MVLSSDALAKLAEPRTLADLVLPRPIAGVVREILQRDGVRYTFHGPPGCGKSTAQRMYLRLLRERHPQAKYIIMDASRENGVGAIRDKLRMQIRQKKMKCVILEECDNMTHEAQESLRNLIGDHARDVSFLLICNNVEKLTPAIMSRAPPLYFGEPHPDDIMKRLTDVTTTMGLEPDRDAMERILRFYSRDIRASLKMINLTELRPERMQMFMGLPNLDDMFVPDVMQREAVLTLWEEQGYNPLQVMNELKKRYETTNDKRLVALMDFRFRTQRHGEGFSNLRCFLFTVFDVKN